jgi:hypothetical protein
MCAQIRAKIIAWPVHPGATLWKWQKKWMPICGFPVLLAGFPKERQGEVAGCIDLTVMSSLV